jgi:hypothetical protein
MRSAGRWRDSNLVRLQRSLRKIRDSSEIIFGPGQWQSLLAGYRQNSATVPQSE